MPTTPRGTVRAAKFDHQERLASGKRFRSSGQIKRATAPLSGRAPTGGSILEKSDAFALDPDRACHVRKA